MYNNTLAVTLSFVFPWCLEQAPEATQNEELSVRCFFLVTEFTQFNLTSLRKRPVR